MANYHGKAVVVTWDSTPLTQVVGWTITFSCPVADSSSIAATYRTKEAGIVSATATVTQKGQGVLLPVAGATPATLQLERTGTPADGGYSGDNVLVTGAETSTGTDGVQEVTYSFEFTGAITFTTA